MALPRILFRARRRRFALLVALGVCQAAGLAAAAWLSRRAFDQLVAADGEATSHPLLLPLALAIAYLAVAALRYAERVTAEKLGQGYAGAVRLLLYDRIARLAPRELQQGGRGGHLLRFIGDLTAIRNWVGLGLARLATSGTALVLAGAVLLAVDAATGAVFCAVLAGTLLAATGLGGRMRAAVAESRRRRARLAGNVDEKIAAMPSVQAFGQVARERQRLRRQSRALREAMVSRARWSAALRGVTDLANGAVIVLVLSLAMAGSVETGSVFAAMTLLGLCLPLLRDLGRVYEYWQGYRVARDNVVRFLVAPAATLGRRGKVRRPRRPRGALRFREVGVGHLLQGVDLEVAGGERVLVTGANGSGKSTLLALAGRLLDPECGRVELDGIDLRQIPAAELRRLVSMVSPDLPLLRGSLRYNLCYRSPDMTDDQIEALCRRCGIDEWVAADPRGLDRRIAAGGANLSLGERTQLALARALAGEPAVLLLDELDAHLDARTRERIRGVLDDFSGTVIAISHGAPECTFDRIWKVDAGSVRVIGDGTGGLSAAA